MGLPIVSARLAEVLALGPDQAQYREADCSACAPAVRDMGYRALNLLAFANPLDRERTAPGQFVDLETPAGPTYVWVRPPVGPNTPLPSIVWREDFVPPAPVFRMPGSGWTLATEELAGRMADAGFDDVAFLDLTGDGTGYDLADRTRRRR